MQRYEKYKDSGVKWIGEIPEHWEAKPMYGIATNWSKGQGISKDQVYDNGDTPCVRYGEIYTKYNFYFDTCVSKTNASEITSKSYVHKGDILFAATGEKIEEIGKSVVFLGEEALVGGDIIVCQHNQDPKFMAYVLSATEIQNQKSYGKMKLKVVHISSNRLKRVSLPLPPLPEQQGIVAYLDAKTEKIDLYIAQKEKEIERLQELKQVEIADAVTHGLNPNAKMKPSGIAWIGDIPEHWEVKRLALSFTENKTKNSDYAFDHALKFNYGSLVPKNEQGDVSELKDTYIAYTIINKNDIAINCLNLNYDFISQRVAIARQNGILTSAYLIITPRKGVNSEFYNYLFKAMDSKKLFHGMGTGIRLTLSYSELKKQPIVVPPIEEQTAIVRQIEAQNAKIDTMADSLRQQIARLKELKQRIISDAVTGKIKV